MVRYVKCPRCELNYIDGDKQQFCDVCIKEMKGLDDDPFMQEDEEEETELCPVCGENMMHAGEKMCEECKQKSEYEEEEDPETNLENDEEWRSYLDSDSDAERIELEGLDDDDDDEEEETEEESNEEDDMDFEYVTGDDIYKYSDDFDDDDDDEEEEDDFDDDEDAAPRSRRKKKEDSDF